MANMRITWPNRLADATYRATPGIWTTQLPPANLATRQIAQVARSVGLSNVHAYVDAGSAIKAEVVAMAGHNLTTAGEVRVRGYSADPHGDYWWDFGPTAASQTITCTAPGSSGSYAGTYWGADGLLKESVGTSGIGGTPRYTHAELTADGECLGLLLEPARTNYVLHSRDGANAAWTKSNATATRTATGIDGAANTATRVTATNSNGRISQALTLSASTRRFSLYARRVTGTGTVSVTVNNFGATSTITLTDDWQRFDVTQTLSNPTVGVQIATSGDAIDIDCVQLEEGGYPTTPIITTTATVTRAADSVTLTVPASSNHTILAVLRCLNAPTADEYALVRGSATTGSGVYVTTGGNASSRGVVSGAAYWDLGSTAIVGTEHTFCWSATTNDIACSVDGAAVTTDASATVGSGEDISSAFGRTGVYVVKMVATWNAVSSDADVEALSGTLARATADFDSGATDAWPPAWVSDTTAEQQAGVAGCAVLAGTSTAYRYWRIDLVDAANPAGYIELGRLFGGSAWSPTINAEFGASIGYEDRDVVTEMDSGSEYMRKRPAPRVAQFALPAASDAEAMRTLLDMQRRQGSSGEVLFEWDSADTTYAPDRRFLARLRQVSPLQAIFVDRWGAEFQVRELL
jgi:hypothetical protein